MRLQNWARGLAALAAIAGSAALAEEQAPIDQVIAAERAFADYTRANGFKQGFLRYVADDGIVFQPGPVRARPGLEALPDAAPPGPPLFWWPHWAGVANSGDLGFTTGGATILVRYFTVWQRQADGSWRWIYDGGPPHEAVLPGPTETVARLAPATASAGSAERAIAEIAPLEADLAERAATDAPAAHLSYLSDDALVAGSRTISYPGREHHAAELARRPARMTLRSQGGVASRGGDMAFTYGEARWTRDERPRWGHYARIWQKRTEGWRLVADVLIPAPGAPPT